MQTPRKIAIIGSNSFIGSAFKEFCKERVQLYLLDRNNGYSYENVDVMTDVLEELKPDTIVNFSSQSMVAESWAEPDHYMHINATQQIKLHNYLKNKDWLNKFLHFSTPEVYGSNKFAVTSWAHMNPSTPYAVSRAACDMSLRTFHKQYGFPVVITRAANVYGPGQQLFRIIPKLMIKAMKREPVILDGGGNTIRSFLYIDDVVKGIWDSLFADAGKIIHLATDEIHSIKDIANMINEFVDHPLQIQEGPDRPGKDLCYYLDCELSKLHINWDPKVSLEEGLLKTHEWIDNNFEKFKTMSLEYNNRLD